MRSGDWMALQSGTKWFVTDPHPDDVKIEDITHGLALICRFGGHCRTFYSVAQHSLLVADVLAKWHPRDFLLQIYGLVHDASEAYLGDVVRPLKVQMPQYKELENLTSSVIYCGLGLPTLPVDQWAILKQADDVALMTERRDLVNHCGHEWSPRAEPDPRTIIPMSPGASGFMFREQYETLRAFVDVQQGRKS